MAKKTRGTRTSYPTDVTDEEWDFCAPYLTLMREDAPQREWSMRAIFNAVRYVVRTGCAWRMLPNDLPPWYTVHQQAQRWISAGCFEAMAHDLRKLLRIMSQREPDPSATILDARTMRSTPESGARGGYDGHKKKKGSKVHAAVDTLGHLLALKITAANEQERAQVEDLVEQVQEATAKRVQLAYVDQGYTGQSAEDQAAKHDVQLVVVKLQEAKRGFVLLPRRWVVERSFAWASRFRRLARDYERIPESLAGMHWLAFIMLMLNSIFSQSS